MFFKWSLSLRRFYKDSVCPYPLLNIYHMPCPYHSLSFVHCNNIRQQVLMMKILALQFPPASCYFLPPSSKYLPQNPDINYCRLHERFKIHAQTKWHAKFWLLYFNFNIMFSEYSWHFIIHMEFYSNLFKKLLL